MLFHVFIVTVFCRTFDPSMVGLCRRGFGPNPVINQYCLCLFVCCKKLMIGLSYCSRLSTLWVIAVCSRQIMA